jgi:hypothetical protein
MQGHVVRMLNWLDADKEITSLRATPVASPKMMQPFYELSNSDGGLFLYLMPYNFFQKQVPAASLAALASTDYWTQQKGAITDRAQVCQALDAAKTPRLRFDSAEGFLVIRER